MRRRDFLGVAATLAISTTTGPHAVRAAPGAAVLAENGRSTLIADRLLQAYPLRKSLAAIGNAFWNEKGSSGIAGPARLTDAVHRLLHHLDMPEAELRAMSMTAIRDRIKSGTLQDFSKQRIVQVRGWLLGETEARLCAIASLRTA